MELSKEDEQWIKAHCLKENIKKQEEQRSINCLVEGAGVDKRCARCFLKIEKQADIEFFKSFLKGTYSDDLTYGEILLFLSLGRTYKNSAKKRRLYFNLSQKEMFTIMKKSCFYCGSKPKQKINSGDSEFIYNGIDRINNKDGYTNRNTVPCCGRCNRMKNILAVDDFLYQCLKINKYTRRKKKCKS